MLWECDEFRGAIALQGPLIFRDRLQTEVIWANGIDNLREISLQTAVHPGFARVLAQADLVSPVGTCG